MRKFVAVAALLMFLSVLVQASAAEKVKRTDAEKNAIAQIRKLGGHVLEIAQDDNRLEVAYHLTDGKVTGKHLQPLAALKNSLAQLNLRGTEITDNDLAQLKDLTALVRLHLENTATTDKGLVHLKALVNLEYLNLYGTQVSDAGLDQLAPLKKLKKVYIWQSKVTIAGVIKFKKAMPGTQIIPDLVVEKQKEEARQKALAEAKKQAIKLAADLKTQADKAKLASIEEQKKAGEAAKVAAAAKKTADDDAKIAAEAQKLAEATKKKVVAAKKLVADTAKKAAEAKKRADAAAKAAADSAKKADEAQKKAAALEGKKKK